MKNKSTYDEALQELQRIVEQLQSNSIPMDELAQKVKRAASLIKYCKTQLRTTEEEIKDLFT